MGEKGGRETRGLERERVINILEKGFCLKIHNSQVKASLPPTHLLALVAIVTANPADSNAIVLLCV